MVPEPQAGADGEPTLQELSAALVGVCGTDYGVHTATWISRFTDAARQAATYRRQRIFLAGDAAHVHSPVGGQGLNTGVQDAMNLGWKLAQVAKGLSPESLLDTYHAERHPVGARVLRRAMAGSALLRADAHTDAVRDTLAELLAMDEPRKQLASELSGLDVRYDLGDGHPLLGRRMPDLDLTTTTGPRRVFSLLHGGQAVLLDLDDTLDVSDWRPWAGRIRCVRAKCESPWEPPSLETAKAPTAVLIRPDGYVAWVAERTAEGLADAMSKWCGPPTL
jgi:hypothetical protein